MEKKKLISLMIDAENEITSAFNHIYRDFFLSMFT